MVGMLLRNSIQYFRSFINAQFPPPSCQQYLPSASGSSSLECSTVLTSCHFVNASLDRTEAQLRDVFSQIEALLTDQTPPQCLGQFRSLYCLQTYQLCGEVGSGGTFEPVSRDDGDDDDGGGVCGGDCVRVITEVCGETEWSHFSTIIDQLRMNRQDLLSLPPLLQLSDCSSSSSNTRRCMPLLGSNDNSSSSTPSDCGLLTTPEPPSVFTPSPALLSTGAIVGICIVSMITIFLAILLLVFILYLASQQRRMRKSRTSRDSPTIAVDLEASSSAASLKKLDSAAKLEVQQRAPRNEEKHNTLMLRASAVHEALLDVNLSPRSTTISRRLKTSEFLKLSPKQRLQQLEYPRGNICLVRDLWETNFGYVYMGEASGLEHEQDQILTSVFIKSLHHRASPKLRQQFKIEMTWASGFSHPNIISLLGVCTLEDPQYMMFEYLEYGSLKEFLQSVSSMWSDFDQLLGDTESANLEDINSPDQSMLGVSDLAGMACQVADGMDYLTKKAFVLKDLAARNCQVRLTTTWFSLQLKHVAGNV